MKHSHGSEPLPARFRLALACAQALAIHTLLAGSGWAADALVDPTRPAPEWLAARPGAAEAAPAAPAVPSVVQFVLIGKSRRFAFVDGQLVEQGAVHNGSKIVGIDESGVAWKGQDSSGRLSLNPAVTKRVRDPGEVPARGRSGNNNSNGENR